MNAMSGIATKYIYEKLSLQKSKEIAIENANICFVTFIRKHTVLIHF